MSDARTDFFARAEAPDKRPTRDDFFAGNDDPETTPEASKPHGKGYMDAAAIRKGGFNPVTGGGEAALQMVTGTGSSIAGGIAGLLNAGFNHSPLGFLAHKAGLPEADSADLVNSIQEGGTYQPRTASGQEVSGAIAGPANPLNWPGMAGQAMGDKAADWGAPAIVSAGLRVLPDAAATLMGARASRMRSAPVDALTEAQGKMNAAASSQSMGAAAAAPDLKTLSPELQQSVVKAVRETGGAVNPEALARHVQADSLPVKVRLSEGQALGDERLISHEMNSRGKHEEYSKAFKEQNKALTENLQAMREQAGPDVFSTNHVEHGDTLIGRYQAIDEARNADISAKYQALRDAAGGEFPVDAKTLLDDASKDMHKELVFEYAPKEFTTLQRLADSGNMTFEQFEKLRSNLATTMRDHTVNGNTRTAAGVIRDAMERLPLKAEAAQLKPLADTARAAARERFQALDADPAYKAAVKGTTPPDKFVQKFVINGTRDGVAKLSEAMGADETAAQTLKVATLDHLRQAAGIDSAYNGNFTQAGYNKALRQLEPKIGSLLDPKSAETARTLGDVARYTQFQPRGSFVNNSNTFVAAAGEHMADAAAGIANLKAGGIPVGSFVKDKLTDRGHVKRAAATFAPGAGLTKLSDMAKMGKDKK